MNRFIIHCIGLFMIFMPLNGMASDVTLCGNEKTITHEPRADVTHNPSPVTINDPVQIPLTIDIAKHYDIDLPEGMEMNHDLGMVTIYNDSRIMYDNKDISGNIEDKCKDNDTSEFETIIKDQTK